MATGVLHVPPCTAWVQAPLLPAPSTVPLLSVLCEYITCHGLLASPGGLGKPTPLSTAQAAYRPPLVSMPPTTKSLVVEPNSLVAILTWPQVIPPSQEIFTSAPFADRPMNSYSVPVALLMY